MEADWVAEYLEGYRHDGLAVLRRLVEGTRGRAEVPRIRSFLMTYASVPAEVDQDAGLREVMVRLTQALFLAMDESAWTYIAQVWPGILASAQRLGHPELEGAIAIQLGIILNNLGRSREAQVVYEAAVSSRWFALLPADQQGGILHQFGVCLRAQGRLGDARRVFERALSILDGIAEPSVVAGSSLVVPYSIMQSTSSTYPKPWFARGYSLQMLGMIAMMEGKRRVAGDYFRRSLAEFESHGEADNLACVVYEQLGLWHLDGGEVERAIEYLERSLRIRMRRGELQGPAHCAIYLAEACLAAGQLDRAEDLLVAALTMHQELNEAAGKARSHLVLGCLERQRGRPEDALREWQITLDLLAASPLPEPEVRVRYERTRLLLRQRRFREARSGLVHLHAAYSKQYDSIAPAIRFAWNHARRAHFGLARLKSPPRAGDPNS